MYRFGATTLDAYLMYRDSDWFTYQKLVDQLSGKDELSRAARIGISFQRLVESFMNDGDYDEQIVYLSDCSELAEIEDNVFYAESFPFWFNTECFRILFETKLPINSIPELKSKLTYKTSHGPVDVVCKTDAAMGLVGYDTKTSLKAMQADRYTDKYQWRFYSVCFGFTDFVWPLVQLKELKDAENYFDLHSIKTAHQSSYPGMEKDCERLVNEFMGFCADNNLLEHLRPYWEKQCKD